jgi:hypothetical protein
MSPIGMSWEAQYQVVLHLRRAAGEFHIEVRDGALTPFHVARDCYFNTVYELMITRCSSPFTKFLSWIVLNQAQARSERRVLFESRRQKNRAMLTRRADRRHCPSTRGSLRFAASGAIAPGSGLGRRHLHRLYLPQGAALRRHPPYSSAGQASRWRSHGSP